MKPASDALEGSGSGIASTAHVQIFSDGRFGDAVADHLASLLVITGRTAEVVNTSAGNKPLELKGKGDLVIHASWRDVAPEFDEIAAVAESAGRAALPIAFSHPRIRVGPLIRPGLAPCHQCYAARIRQHAWSAREAGSDEMEREMSLDPSLGVDGLPPHVAMMSAALALALIGDSADPVPAGQVALIDCRTDAVTRSPVIPVHGCPACEAVTANKRTKPRRNQERLRALVGRPAAALAGDAP
jgi:bacteriocin biosynthesis cyclodehydratase domain-containing protein